MKMKNTKYKMQNNYITSIAVKLLLTFFKLSQKVKRSKPFIKYFF